MLGNILKTICYEHFRYKPNLNIWLQLSVSEKMSWLPLMISILAPPSCLYLSEPVA